MICKNCQKEMPDVGDFCPFCAAEKETQVIPAEEITFEETPAEEICEEVQEEPKPKTPLWKWILVIGGGIVLLGVLVMAILYGAGIDFKPKANDITYKQVYAYAEEEAVKKKDKVVATIGDKELTNGELQLYYQNVVTSFYSEAYYYMSFLGLDPTQPLSAQECATAEGMTWEQYFLDSALNNWQAYTLLEILAENQGYTLPDAVATTLESDVQRIEDLALEAGYADADAYIHEMISINVDAADYHRFNWVYFLSNNFLNDYYVSAYPDQAAIDAYFAANEATFASNGITKDMGLISDVRHILVAVEGGTEAEDGTVTYSEEEWATAKAEAERILQEWKDGEATEASFSLLAVSYTDDTASAASGGLYTDVSCDSSYMEAFENWAIDPARQAGDTAIVQTPYGYHIMYFVRGEDYCNFLVAEEVIAEQVRVMMLTAKTDYPVEIDYKDICLVEPMLG